MAKSLAFWIDSDKQSESTTKQLDTKIDIHINYWLLNQSRQDELHYLDFGIKFEKLPKTGSMNVFLPFKIKKTDYHPNLGELVCKRTDLIQTIFNARHKSTRNSSNTSFDIEFDIEDPLRVHTQISIGSHANEVSLVETDEGSIISFPTSLFDDENIDLPEAPISSKASASDAYSIVSNVSVPRKRQKPPAGYIRFRVKLDAAEARKSLSQRYKHKDSKMLSRLENTEIVDFRINEVRDLPGTIQSKNISNSKIKNIHFFIIREVDSEFKQAHANFHRCRLLEKELWQDYLSLDSNNKIEYPRQMLIYHWKESAYKSKDEKNSEPAKDLQIEKFTAFAKFSKITVSYSTLITFLLVAVSIGIISSLLANGLQELLKDPTYRIITFLTEIYRLHFP